MKGKKYFIVISLILLVVLAAVALVACDKDKDKDKETKYTLSLVCKRSREGSVVGGGSYSEGNYVSITAIANKGYKFFGWYDGDDLVSNKENYTFTMGTKDLIYTAKFAENPDMSIFEFTSDTQRCTITGLKDKSVTEIVVPSCVTDIDDEAFKFLNNITSITFPSSLQTIGDGAFQGCTNLLRIVIPNGVVSIGRNAFKSCSKLKNITIPDSVRSIGEEALGSCYNLTSLTIPFVGETKDSEDANLAFIFSRIPESLTNLVITNSEIIPEGAFRNCFDIKSITLSDKTKYISNAAFDSCLSLSEIHIPDSVVYIGTNAFIYCRSLTSITIPRSVKYIDKSAFYECYALAEVYNLSSLDIEEGMHEFGQVAYYALDVYNSLDIVSKLSVKDGFVIHNDGDIVTLVKYIGKEQDVIVPESVTAIKEGAFVNNKYITNVTLPKGVLTIGNEAFALCENLINIEIPDSVQSIGKRALTKCKNLKNLNIPKSTVSIADDAFVGCSGLETITVAEDNPNYRSNGNCLIDTQNKSLILGSNKSVIPNDGSITAIANNAFLNLEGLTNIVIPEGVTSIGDLSFADCKGLMNLVIPKSVVSIGKDAFAGCNNLENIIVANDNARYSGAGNCLIDLTTKTLLRGCKNSVIPDNGSVAVIGDRAFADCNGLTNIVIPKGVTAIESGAFNGCSFLTSIIIPDSVKFIEHNAFYNCDSLRSFAFENTEGWYITENKDATDGVAIDVTDPEVNANKFREYKSQYWKRK